MGISPFAAARRSRVVPIPSPRARHRACFVCAVPPRLPCEGWSCTEHSCPTMATKAEREQIDKTVAGQQALFVGSLATSISDEDLCTAFEKFGDVITAKVRRDCARLWCRRGWSGTHRTIPRSVRRDARAQPRASGRRERSSRGRDTSDARHGAVNTSQGGILADVWAHARAGATCCHTICVHRRASARAQTGRMGAFVLFCRSRSRSRRLTSATRSLHSCRRSRRFGVCGRRGARMRRGRPSRRRARRRRAARRARDCR